MSRIDELVDELVSMILMQHEEIKKLERKIERIKQYIEVYEEYIEERDQRWQR